MSSNDEIFKAIGQLQSSVTNIERNTAKVPQLFTDMAIAKSEINQMKPKVERHQKIVWIGSGVLLVFSGVWTLALALIEGGHHDTGHTTGNPPEQSRQY